MEPEKKTCMAVWGYVISQPNNFYFFSLFAGNFIRLYARLYLSVFLSVCLSVFLQAAAHCFEDMILLEPNNPHAHTRLADCYYTLGKRALFARSSCTQVG